MIGYRHRSSLFPLGSSDRLVDPRPDRICGQAPGNRDDHSLSRREINFGRVDRQVIVPGVKPVEAGEGPNIAAAFLVRALDHLNGLSPAARMIDAHDPLHPEPLRGVNHDVEEPCPAAQQVESAAAENYNTRPFDCQFGNEAVLDLHQLFVGEDMRRRRDVHAGRSSQREDRNQCMMRLFSMFLIQATGADGSMPALVNSLIASWAGLKNTFERISTGSQTGPSRFPPFDDHIRKRHSQRFDGTCRRPPHCYVEGLLDVSGQAELLLEVFGRFFSA